MENEIQFLKEKCEMLENQISLLDKYWCSKSNLQWREHEKKVIDLFMVLRLMLMYLEESCLGDPIDKHALFEKGNDIFNECHHIYSACIKEGIKRAEKEGTQSEWQKITREKLKKINEVEPIPHPDSISFAKLSSYTEDK